MCIFLRFYLSTCLAYLSIFYLSGHFSIYLSVYLSLYVGVE